MKHEHSKYEKESNKLGGDLNIPLHSKFWKDKYEHKKYRNEISVIADTQDI